MLRSRITPFYAIEAGVAMRVQEPGGNMFNGMNGFDRNMEGGMIGAVAFGLKFHTKRRVHFDLSAVADFKNVNYRQTTTLTDVFGNPYSYSQRKTAMLLFPGIRFGIGF